MDPELETLEASFNARLEPWISQQGLLYQFTHDTGSGIMFAKICGLFFRLLIVALIALVVFWIYLINRPNSEAFKLDLEDNIAAGLNAQKVVIENITRDKGGLLTGEMVLSSVSLGETENSFFEDWFIIEEAESVGGRKIILDTQKFTTLEGVSLKPYEIGDDFISSKWSADELSILSMELKLKVGADTDEEALANYSSLFKEYKGIDIKTIQVFDAILFWGHVDNAKGSIKGAQLEITKRVNSWEIDVTGGTFSHGWLKNASINKMKVICKKSGEVEIQSASLNLGNGSLKFNASIKIKAQPEISGAYSFKNVEVIDLIGSFYEKWLDGSIDGKGLISGNLNSPKGLKTTTTIQLTGNSRKIGEKGSDSSVSNDKESVIVIRGSQFSLLKLMQMKDPRNSYTLLRVHRGQLIVNHEGQDTQVTLRDVRCGQNDLMLMNGEFDYAYRTDVEVKEKIDVSSLELRAEEGATNENSESDSALVGVEGVAKETVRAFSGSIKLGLIPEVFEENIKVFEVYPVDKSTLRVWFNIDLNGQLDELTEELSDELYEIMKPSENN